MKSPDDALNEVDELKETIARLEDEVDEGDQRITELESDASGYEDARKAIEAFLARCERPVGKRSFTIKLGRMTDQAIVGLFDAIGRNL